MSYAAMLDRIEAVNLARDIRNRQARTEFTITMPAAEGEDEGRVVELPTHFEVCPACRGNGTTVNPAIDCGGLSSEDFDDDPDFAESYMSGAYDQTCAHCGGERVVKVVDWDRVPDDVRAEAERQAADERRDFEEHLAEIRAGC